MREIHVDEIRDNVAQICIEAAYNVSDDVLTAFDRALETETVPAAQGIIELLKENARIGETSISRYAKTQGSQYSLSKWDRTCG